jgi:hypothetical protein
MKTEIGPRSIGDNMVVQEMNGEVLVYDLDRNKAFCLNQTSSLVWQACDGSRDVATIARTVSSKLGKDAGEDVVWLALDQLKKEKLIVNAPSEASPFAGMSRRQVIQKVGMGALVALPMVMGLVAPAAAQVGSVNCGTTCAMDVDCAPAPTNSCRMCPNGGGVCGP